MPKNSELRVISGRFRGRILRSPLDSHTHPMGAREKLALFNMVNVEQVKVLDAYAGSGALGIEALSRGALEVIFVENHPKAASIIKQNLQTLGVNPTPQIHANEMNTTSASFSQVLKLEQAPQNRPRKTTPIERDLGIADVCVFLEKVAKFTEKSQFHQYFDVIFADPPYDKLDFSEISLLVQLLKPGGTLALSSPSEQAPPELPALRIVSTHTYARAQITIYRKN